MSGLGLTPNEIIGYRIKADWYSFNVVLVKRHGPNSKNAGKEYETTLGYCKSLPYAVSYIVSHATRMYGEVGQADRESIDGTVADARALHDAIRKAEAAALAAVADIVERIKASGVLNKDLVRALGAPVAGEDEPADPAADEAERR